MKTITESINLYKYSELSKESQDNAINDCVNAWMECPYLVPDEAKEQYEEAGQRSERMQTPWFWGSYIWEYCEKWVLEQCNRAWYLEDGEFHRWMVEGE